MTTKRDAAAAELARRRAESNRRTREIRARAAMLIGGLTLSREDAHALRIVQRGLHAPNRAAAIRAAIHLAAEVLRMKQAAEHSDP